MADTKISGLAALTSLAVGDLFTVVDVSDTSMAASGTNVKITAANVAAFILASPTVTGTLAAAGITASSTIVQTSNSAAAFESGPNGSTNPVFRLVNSTASQATGLSITGNAAGSNVTVSAISSGTNESIDLTPKGDGQVRFPFGTATKPGLGFLTTTDRGFFGANSGIWYTIGGTSIAGADASGFAVKSSLMLGFSSGIPGTNGLDTAFSRISAGLIGVGTGGAGSFAASLKLTQLFADQTITAGGTTGDQTINKSAGTVNIAAAGTSVTVTSNKCTTSSQVFAVIRTNDSTATIKNVVPGAGSFVITLGAAATAEVSIGWWILN